MTRSQISPLPQPRSSRGTPLQQVDSTPKRNDRVSKSIIEGCLCPWSAWLILVCLQYKSMISFVVSDGTPALAQKRRQSMFPGSGGKNIWEKHTQRSPGSQAASCNHGFLSWTADETRSGRFLRGAAGAACEHLKSRRQAALAPSLPNCGSLPFLAGSLFRVGDSELSP